MSQFDISEVEESAEQLKEFNKFLEEAIPIIVPEAEKTLELLKPILEKYLDALFVNKSFDSLVVMGNASYLCRELIKTGVTYEEAPKIAVSMAREIVNLSRKY